LALLRGSFFPHLRAALERRAILEEVDDSIASSSRMILSASDASAWYDEGHAVEIYEQVARLRDLAFVRDVGCDAARHAMSGSWRDLIQALTGLIGATPRLAFEQVPVVWNSTRRDAGEVRCCESTTKHVVTELHGFPYTASAAWNEVWAGHHDALLRHLRFGGLVTIDAVAGRGADPRTHGLGCRTHLVEMSSRLNAPRYIKRVHCDWGGALPPR
jgi:hypothetical protein